MGGATDGFTSAGEDIASRPFEQLSIGEVEGLQFASSEYLRDVFDHAKEYRNERLMGAVAAFAFVNKSSSDPELYRLVNDAFPTQDWQVW